MVHPFTSAPNFVSVTPSMGVLFPMDTEGQLCMVFVSESRTGMPPMLKVLLTHSSLRLKFSSVLIPNYTY